MENINKSQKLKELLPYGFGTKLSKEFNVSTTWVYRVLDTWDTDSPILKALIDLAEKNQLNKKDLDKRLEKITNL